MSRVVVSCEHASWRLPAGCDLGVPLDILQSQASWDHGALDIAHALATSFNSPLFAGQYSRMFVDLNRPANHADVIPRHSYGADVPGNVGICAMTTTERIARYHAPYWMSVASAVDAALQSNGACLHLSSHSFSPQLDPAKRDFDVGVLFDPSHDFEANIALEMVDLLNHAGLRTRANQPYSGAGAALVTGLRNSRRTMKYAGIEIEASHAVTAQAGGCDRISAAVAAASQSILARWFCV
jgi:predicted N-formylglutamate amidohydrolase